MHEGQEILETCARKILSNLLGRGSRGRSRGGSIGTGTLTHNA